ncbi:hypothetical protein BgiMline_004785 [Biomphalaria glabrata]|nr:cell wall protein IFF6-like [Biomphalaria glabrata]
MYIPFPIMTSEILNWKKSWLLVLPLIHQVLTLPFTDTVSHSPETTTRTQCLSLESSRCTKFYSSFLAPNVYGDLTFQDASQRLESVLVGYAHLPDTLLVFLCSLYMPPCLDNVKWPTFGSKAAFRTPLPCMTMCELAEKEIRALRIGADVETTWPISCSTLPTDYCLNLAGPTTVAYVKSSINVKHFRSSVNDIVSFAPLEVELGNENEYELEVVTLSDAKIPSRRYDIADLGDPDYFQGWADVQGIGAANDYCRVVGKAKRRFLSCNLAGSRDQGHHYVSKLGFEAGHPNTWFMRDMDGDGRDDYCRCLLFQGSSKTTCMKSGERGFYGSTTQGGNQHTFSLPGSDGCHTRRINHVFGE